ncbi:flagellar basal-body rod protein FlgG [Desulfohalotomaculum tongense]|uniref:flagellar hook-basal body complex protein n=1 Tax=Desulforadius tongensis TaxID=1216062 RepID=UPI0019565967|nr:flagellar basal-body rod protein FlgG [Desulforadius tongensis]
MLKTIQSGRSGLLAQQLQMAAIGNNLANINTSGYKRDETKFAELVRQKMGNTGIPVLPGGEEQIPEVGGGVQLVEMGKAFEQGDLQKTGRPLDLAIEGEGFFGLKKPGGETVYTRSGSFSLIDGRIVNAAGCELLMTKDGKPVKEKDLEKLKTAGEILVERDGRVTAVNSKGQREVVGEIKLYRFENPRALIPAGQNMFTAQPGGEVPKEITGKIHQGYLEKSNVDIIKEMTKLIEAQKAYSFNARSIKTADQMWSMANNLRR